MSSLDCSAPEEKRTLQRQIREHSQEALLGLTVKWLQFAADPANAAYQKWVLFLSDILPTGYQAVLNAEVDEGSTVVIYGAGPVGQMAAACALFRKPEGCVGLISPCRWLRGSTCTQPFFCVAGAMAVQRVICGSRSSAVHRSWCQGRNVPRFAGLFMNMARKAAIGISGP